MCHLKKDCPDYSVVVLGSGLANLRLEQWGARDGGERPGQWVAALNTCKRMRGIVAEDELQRAGGIQRCG